jgi:ribosome-associated protein
MDIATKAAGNLRRAHILLGDLLRQRVLDEVVRPVEVCSWLTQAKAGDVVLIDVHGRAGFTDYLVLATGHSHVHSGSLVQAVRHRLKENLKGRLAGVDEGCVRKMLEEAGQGQYVQEAGIDLSQLHVKVEAPAVSGVPGSDWLAVDAGKVMVHVMSAAARQYYDVEGIWGLPGTVKRFIGEAYVTKDSIGQASV